MPFFLVLLMLPVISFAGLLKDSKGAGQVSTQSEIDRYNCSPVDLRSTLGPVRDQIAGDCYAQTAADVASQAIFQSHNGVLKKNDRLSSTQMAYLYKKMMNENFTSDGGHVREALLALLANGNFCTEENMSQGAYLAVKKIGNASVLDKNDAPMKSSVENEAIKKFVANSCQQKLNTSYKVASADEDFVDTINKALNQGRIAGVGYDTKFLVSGKGGPHASPIVGRRMVDGKCQYLLRNSWGLSCDSYNETYRKKCSAGYVWVDIDALADQVDEVDYIPATKAQAEAWQKLQPSTYSPNTPAPSVSPTSAPAAGTK